LIIASVT